MEIPDLVRDALGSEEVRAGISLGDEDVCCLTPTRTLVYRGEGLLSDDSIEEFPHDVERLDVSDGRRKTKFSLTYVDGTRTFTVPGSRADAVLEHLLDGILTVADVIDPDESVAGVFRFSELTLVVTEGRLVKHVGAPVWDEDFEEFPFAEVTGLSFEEGSVATQIVLSVNGRPQRIKAPNDQAPMVREALQDALFAYHDVGSLAALNDAVAGDEGDDPGGANTGRSGSSVDLGLSEDIDPLVGGDTDDTVDSEPDTVEPTEPDSTAASSAGSADDAGRSADASADNRETTVEEPADRGTEGTAGDGSAAPPDGDGSARRGTSSSEPEPSSRSESPGQSGSSDRAGASAQAEPSETGESTEQSASNEATGSVAADAGDRPSTEAASGERTAAVPTDDVAEMADRVEDLTIVVKRQNELLRKQHETLQQLIEELKQSR